MCWALMAKSIKRFLPVVQGLAEMSELAVDGVSFEDWARGLAGLIEFEDMVRPKGAEVQVN
jgi:hypothetical protein